MSKDVKDEYINRLMQCERKGSSKLWKSFHQYVLELKATHNLDREDAMLLIQGLTKLGLYKQAFDLIDRLDHRNKKENKMWYELKILNEQWGDNQELFGYLTSKKQDVDRLITMPFRDKISKESSKTNGSEK